MGFDDARCSGCGSRALAVVSSGRRPASSPRRRLVDRGGDARDPNREERSSKSRRDRPTKPSRDHRGMRLARYRGRRRRRAGERVAQRNSRRATPARRTLERRRRRRPSARGDTRGPPRERTIEQRSPPGWRRSERVSARSSPSSEKASPRYAASPPRHAASPRGTCGGGRRARWSARGFAARAGGGDGEAHRRSAGGSRRSRRLLVRRWRRTRPRSPSRRRAPRWWLRVLGDHARADSGAASRGATTGRLATTTTKRWLVPRAPRVLTRTDVSVTLRQGSFEGSLRSPIRPHGWPGTRDVRRPRQGSHLRNGAGSAPSVDLPGSLRDYPRMAR